MNDLYLIEYNKIHIENPSLSAKVADYQRLLLFTANSNCIIKQGSGFGCVVSMYLCSQLKNTQFEKTRYIRILFHLLY